VLGSGFALMQVSMLNQSSSKGNQVRACASHAALRDLNQLTQAKSLGAKTYVEYL
jgi:hypothetical protein